MKSFFAFKKVIIRPNFVLIQLQYSPKIKEAQEVAQEVLALQEHASGKKRVKLRIIRKKFQMQEDRNPFRKKSRVLPQTTNNCKKLTVVGWISNTQI